MGREDNVNMDQELKQTIECVYELCEEVEKTLQKTVTLQNPPESSATNRIDDVCHVFDSFR